MSAKGKFKFDETKFHPGQREAALLLVEYEFTSTKDRKTKQEIADKVGISRQLMHRWERQDPNFIAYRNYLASEYMDSHLAFVYSKLLEGIGNGSMRGIEAFMKRMGDMDTNSEVTIHSGGDDKSFDERKAELLNRLGTDEDTEDNE